MQDSPLKSARAALGRAVLLAALSSAATVSAQQDFVEASAAPLEDAPGVESPDDPEVWDLRLGLLGAYGPDYEGASNYDSRIIPYLRISWKDRVILRGKSLELNLFRNSFLKFGPTARLRGGRDQDDDRALWGLGDIDSSVEAGAFVRASQGPLRLRATVLHDVSSEHSGMRLRLNAGIQIPFNKPWFLLRADAYWASDNFMDTYYSVNSVQSRRSGLPTFRAKAGFKDAGINIATRVPLLEHWSIIAIAGYSRMLGDAADSPVVSERGDRDQFYVSTGVAYRF